MMFRTPRLHLVLAAIVLNAICASPTVAQVINEDQKILPDDGEAFDNFGSSVAISGTTAVIGAWRNDDNGFRSGSAYLFDTTTGQQLFKLLPSDGASYNLFGTSVAISGTTTVIGAYWDDDNGDKSGSAYLFDTFTGQEIAKLLPNDGAEHQEFGVSVAISGTIVVVGARFDNNNGNRSGSAYLFDAITGEQIAKLLPSDGAAHDYFGHSVAISGNIAVVGAYKDDDNGDDSGSAYLFDTSSGQQIAKLLPSDGEAFDNFGWSIAICGNTAVIGARYHDENGEDSGSAYLFDSPTGQQFAKLLPIDSATDDLFGYSVAISDTMAIIGALGDDDNGISSGSAFFFDTSTGHQLAKLLPSDGEASDNFGHSVAISNTTTVVGATGNDDLGTLSGAAYLFTRISPCLADINTDGSLDFFDVSAFLTAYAANDPTADFNADGIFNFFDVSAFLVAYLAGCP